MTPALFKRDPPKGKPPGPPNFCADLVARARNAEIVYALSDEARKFLSSYTEPEFGSELIGSSLVSLLSQMVLSCERLWEFPTRGVVLKCNANLIAKIIRGNDDYTEYTSIQYLAEYAPEIPSPRPHGLVKFDGVRIMFMTYFPSMTLVTGIIDWETSGFYPDYFEPAKILYLFTIHQESDWWQYLPPCIAPARNPERWLVGRLWDQAVTEF